MRRFRTGTSFMDDNPGSQLKSKVNDIVLGILFGSMIATIDLQ